MDFKTYKKDIFENINQWDRIFNPEKKWENVNLSDINPCKTCAIWKEQVDNCYYYMMAGGAAEELTEQCKHCMDKILWEIECIEKLAWYEDNDERLRKND